MNAIVNFLFPNQCVTCPSLVETPGLCPSCWGKVIFCDEGVCDGCGAPLFGKEVRHGDRCDACIAAPPPWSQGRSAFLYEGAGRELVLRFKHGHRQDLTGPLSQWMVRACTGMVAPRAPDTIVIPVPLHWRRLVARSYNQAALLAQPLAEQLGLEYAPDGLRRIRPTAPLKGGNHNDRAASLAGAITVNPAWAARIKDRTVFLIDDVMTSGATLSECTRACLGAGSAKVCVATLARAAGTY